MRSVLSLCIAALLGIAPAAAQEFKLLRNRSA